MHTILKHKTHKIASFEARLCFGWLAHPESHKKWNFYYFSLQHTCEMALIFLRHLHLHTYTHESIHNIMTLGIFNFD